MRIWFGQQWKDAETLSWQKYPHAMLFYSPNMHSVINMTMGYSESGQWLPLHQEYTRF